MDDLEVLLALRAHLLPIVAVETGLVTMAATATGFTRSAGSYLSDGFKVGMEVLPAGFTDNTPAVIQSLTAGEIKIYGNRPVEASAANRSLTVGIPAQRSWENIEATFLDKRWFIDEDYIPGIQYKVTMTQRGQREHNPQYMLKLYGIAGTGASAMFIVAKAIIDAFPMHSVIATMSDGYVLKVASEPVGPTRTPMMPVSNDPGHTVVVITIPLLKRSQNQA